MTRATLLAAGITPRMLEGPAYTRVLRGVYVIGRHEVTPQLLCRAALLLHPAGARISHHSAALLYGLPVPVQTDVHISVSRAPDRRRTPGLRSHVCPGAASTCAGLTVSAPLQLAIELSSSLSLVEWVALSDALVKRQRMTADRFRELLADAGASARASRMAGLVRSGVDSPMESRLRLLLVLAGLPEPVVDHRLRTTDGHTFLRMDLSYPEHHVLVEYDGRQHARDTQQWLGDIDRREWLVRHDWTQVTVTSEGIYREPGRTLERVRDALLDRGACISSVGEQWRQHFRGSQPRI